MVVAGMIARILRKRIAVAMVERRRCSRLPFRNALSRSHSNTKLQRIALVRRVKVKVRFKEEHHHHHHQHHPPALYVPIVEVSQLNPRPTGAPPIRWAPTDPRFPMMMIVSAPREAEEPVVVSRCVAWVSRVVTARE